MPEERSTVEILKAARERITLMEAWTQNRLSDTLAVLGVFDIHKAVLLKGTCWCASGAILCESPTYESFEQATEVLEATGPPELGEIGVTAFNDSHAHAEVLAALDRAIHLAEQEADHA